METQSSSSSSPQDAAEQQKSLNLKYQKLATEYAKLRSQVQVLKKGVVDEQHNTTRWREQCATQDQSLRKLEQELDSVKFRNRQLEKRIEILQQECCGGGSAPAVGVSTVVDSNLLVHVEQNKQLQESLATLSEKYSTEVGRLRRMIDNEMVPRELMESIKAEHSEKVNLLNKRVKELCNQNSELIDKLRMLNDEARILSSSCGGAGGNQNDHEVVVDAGHSELLVKLSQSEVEKEKLNSEVQILRMKLKRLGSSSDEVVVVKSPTSESLASVTVTTNVIGRSEVIGTLDHELVQGVLRERISELVKLLQVADSKAVYYYHEAYNLCRLVRTSQLSYKRLDSEFNKLKVKYRNVQDELDDTKNGYEQQVNSLTEHIAILNEKLARMVDEIGALKRR